MIPVKIVNNGVRGDINPDLIELYNLAEKGSMKLTDYVRLRKATTIGLFESTQKLAEEMQALLASRGLHYRLIDGKDLPEHLDCCDTNTLVLNPVGRQIFYVSVAIRYNSKDRISLYRDNQCRSGLPLTFE